MRRRRARHEQTVKQVQSLEANWQLARTNSSRVYYFNPEVSFKSMQGLQACS